MSITAVLGGAQRPNRAVGILKDVTGEHEAELDPLTRLYNKRAITEYIESAMRNNPAKNASAFVMMDIDRFKQINDQYGHPIGDQVLCAVAESLRTVFPKPNLSGRFGGDEFCVFCSKSPELPELKKQLSRLSERVKEIDAVDCEKSTVSVSMGVVIFHGHAEFEEIYRKTDEALYKAKKAGRDRYCISERE